MRKSIYTREYGVFVRVLRETRQAAGIRQEKLAALIGGSQSWVSKVERGECRLDVIELREYCRACGVSLTTFIAALEEALVGVEGEGGE